MEENRTEKPLLMGIDVGSKTAKVVIADHRGEIVHSLYRRHRSHGVDTVKRLLHDLRWRYGEQQVTVCVTGSAGISLASALHLPFVQEVVATSHAVHRRHPEASSVIELGGEDAKVLYLDEPVEQRMNATCAGGTGDFLDGVASMLGVRTRDLNGLAFGAQRIYPIASRCAVFAQTDIRPLINAGARPADIAQSALDAVVRQTLGGLACGRPLKAPVIFLGGPLHHLPTLVISFRKAMGLTDKTGIKPVDAHLYPALGAALLSEDPGSLVSYACLSDAGSGTSSSSESCSFGTCSQGLYSLADLEMLLESLGRLEDDAHHLPPLFETESDKAEFLQRHERERMPLGTLRDAQPPLFLGFDAGSTTAKYALMDSNSQLVAKGYRHVEGDVIDAATKLLLELYDSLESEGLDHAIARAVVTGYGEDLITAAFGFDAGVVETVAHLRGAQHFCPDASFVLDIGGQDMKALWLEDGRVVDAVLNEACSSGCGAFVESSARSLLVDPVAFARKALDGRNPVDLGAKCTVFMTSRVRYAQKMGAKVEDIAAGVAYSIANNVMSRIIGSTRAQTLGDSVVVQGGAFKSDAVLRAFEKVTGTKAIRPDCAHVMGAIGAALVARDEWLREGGRQGRSALVDRRSIEGLRVKQVSGRCPGCGNACIVNILDFGEGRYFISGNMCERAHDAIFGIKASKPESAPNVVALEQNLLSQFGSLRHEGARGDITVGLMNTMELYEKMPFWHTFFTELGFSVVVPSSNIELSLVNKSTESIPSESICYPAKITHARYESLRAEGADIVFMPQYMREDLCPVACGYAHAVDVNIGDSKLVSPLLGSIDPLMLSSSQKDIDELYRCLYENACQTKSVSEREIRYALRQASRRQKAFEATIKDATSRSFQWLRESPKRRLALLFGRPYHVDPALNQSIDRELVQLGFAVVPPLGLEKDNGDPDDSMFPAMWSRSSDLSRLVRRFGEDHQVEIVAIRSFGCGYDAVAFDEAGDRARSLHRPFTALKVDEMADTAHLRIRLRTLEYTSHREDSTVRHGREIEPKIGLWVTPDLCSTVKQLVASGVMQYMDDSDQAMIDLPETCLRCLTEATPCELSRVIQSEVSARWNLTHALSKTKNVKNEESRPKVGLVGNPLVVFDAEFNEHIADLAEELGWQVVYPEPELLLVDDVRYLEQLDLFRTIGVQRILYLQSFGCLKSHVYGKGSFRELSRWYPDMPVTFIEYDPDSSALNRENRVRLALSLK